MKLKEIIDVIPSLDTIAIVCPEAPEDWIYKGTCEDFEEREESQKWMGHQIAFAGVHDSIHILAIW